MNIKLVVLGKLKETYWKDAESEYLKRLKPYAKIELVELPEEAFRDGDDKDKIKEKEAEKLKKHLSGVVIALHERGKEMDSVELSQMLEKLSERGDQLTFIVGGPLGLHQSILDAADHMLSLSQLTFPHQMVRTILLEQLFRSVTIQKGKRYHY